jgi:hypothetical protein
MFRSWSGKFPRNHWLFGRMSASWSRSYVPRSSARAPADLVRFGGTVDKFIGTQFVAFFGGPTADKEDPERTVRAALSIRDWLIEKERRLPDTIGISSGEALVTCTTLAAQDAPPSPPSSFVNVATRLRSDALLDGILVDQQTFRRTRDGIEYRAADSSTATGRSELVARWQALRLVSQPADGASRSRTPFIARGENSPLSATSLHGQGRKMSRELITIVGIPGIGKTRLVAEFRQPESPRRSGRHADVTARWHSASLGAGPCALGVAPSRDRCEARGVVSATSI